MADRVRWKFPEKEEDYCVHFKLDSEWTLCGLAVEGNCDESPYSENHKLQDFVKTTRPADCPQCLHIVDYVKTIKKREIGEVNKNPYEPNN